MFGRTTLAFTLALGTMVGANMVSVEKASAERFYDYNTETWVKQDPRKRLQQRKGPARKFNRRNVSINTRETPGTIIIDTDKKFLYYVTAKNKAIRYGVGVGREGFGWNGAVNIQRKQEWPSWTPPAEMRAREKKKGIILPVTQKGGIDNPLGARALYLYKGRNDTLYRIHGTNQPWTIGQNMSSGCIRMMNKDVEHLYKNTKIGTKVVVIGPGRDASKIYTSQQNPFARLFGG
ncbi:ErfK/YbiS/YcfS/YnhG [hydrothermal vent metagenome]|uniref:ErfK/YbiS/YcfS/YnhG n=1 Tax=hydrothermal vent metagenome TaxID=652676 RepID=A0A3B1ASB0_9ZZZZ